MLDVSFRNMPAPYDQDVCEPKNPVPLTEENLFPTVPMYNRRENFENFDVDTLFFAFYF